MIIADTNIFLAVLLEEPEREALIRLTSGEIVVAPEVLPYEMGNALSALVKKGRIVEDDAGRVLHYARQIPVQLKPVDIAVALSIAVSAGIYAYDAYFIQTALSFRCPLLTLDRRMRQVAQEVGVEVMEVVL
ncbi:MULTISPECIES: type II toxin-antitoxin system VapC family toxin [Prosthecochloris]|uniref:Ribonuclease VapC n=1 Tax=Prosthecochloris vibrioformis TaxID=1098 RepID=A0A5C4S1P7_PROVB|nr:MULTISPECIES: type II toxin-antitoxin system VapC family toxin [Prosthecochloris]ANT65097.1 putative nucleic acid-binding protein [Prosthecochloris sp. CIB 2401]TNJ37088.1 type II toxin-antitoxin system VapC family toxin [Prosthecochloris vibrioformis]